VLGDDKGRALVRAGSMRSRTVFAEVRSGESRDACAEAPGCRDLSARRSALFMRHPRAARQPRASYLGLEIKAEPSDAKPGRASVAEAVTS